MAYVVHKQSRKLYEYKGGNVFKNIVTEQLGEVPDELAAKIFNISLDATEMIGKHPQVRDLIKRLDLRLAENTLTE